MMINNGCLFEFDTSAHVVITIILYICYFHVVWHTLLEIDPVRYLFVPVSVMVREEFSGPGPAVKSK